jgi:hypothetical protein
MNRCELGITEECEGYAHDAHHLVSATNKRCELDQRNGMAVCRHCHNWIHTHDGEFKDWLEDNRQDLVDYVLNAYLHDPRPVHEVRDECIRAIKFTLGLDPHGAAEGDAPIGFADYNVH